MSCEAGKFTRALMIMANAGALRLLDWAHIFPLSQKIENFTRYLLEQLQKDEGVELEGTVLYVYGAATWSQGTFIGSRTNWERIARPFQHSLIYDVPESTSFSDLFGHSLHNKGDATRAFCKASRRLESMTQHRELRSLPNV
eukprot:gb/GEZJ01000548.1/.p2 GENE.gb/GEZJ01000548.1/~~gb/GEZJ01000548.1/.p2  ORF type:complete len:142 (-),score=7.62 gb/GEZJ01000548.1/:2199-2624(-)